MENGVAGWEPASTGDRHALPIGFAMRLEPILRAHEYMKVERSPELWEADTEDSRFLPLLGEIIAAALAGGTPLAELTLNASNIVVDPPDDGEAMVAPEPAEYVAITVRGVTDLGPDDTWHPSALHRPGLLFRLHDRLEVAGAKFAYVRRIPPEGSLTVFFSRLAPPRLLVAGPAGLP
jgi:hypothetical protein